MIRSYRSEDRPAVCAHLVAFQDHERTREPEYRPGVEIADEYLAGLLAAVAGGTGEMVVAEVEGVVVGYAAFALCPTSCLTFPTEVEVIDLYVSPAQRGRGFGRAMLGVAESFARERGAARLSLTTLARNAEGRAMYAACGFREFEVTLVRPVGSQT